MLSWRRVARFAAGKDPHPSKVGLAKITYIAVSRYCIGDTQPDGYMDESVARFAAGKDPHPTLSHNLPGLAPEQVVGEGTSLASPRIRAWFHQSVRKLGSNLGSGVELIDDDQSIDGRTVRVAVDVDGKSGVGRIEVGGR